MDDLARNIEWLLLDLDGTLYPFTSEFEQHCNIVAAETAVRLGLPLTFDQALKLALQSYKKYNASMYLFEKRYNLPVEKWHPVFHQKLNSDFVGIPKTTAQLIRDCPLPKALMSHSTHEWIIDVLEKACLLDAFKQILGVDKTGYLFKHEKILYSKIFRALGISQPGTVAIIEDSLPNLKAAKAVGINTVFVTHGRAFHHAEHPYVDYVFNDVSEFLTLLHTALIKCGRMPAQHSVLPGPVLAAATR